MQRYKKRPIQVEAVQLTEEILDTVPHPDHVEGVLYDPVNRIARIKTHMGTMIAVVGSWIVRDSTGAVYPVKAKTFEAMFEPATPEDTAPVSAPVPALRLVGETGEPEETPQTETPGPGGCGSG